MQVEGWQRSRNWANIVQESGQKMKKFTKKKNSRNQRIWAKSKNYGIGEIKEFPNGHFQS